MAVTQWLKTQGTDFYQQGTGKLHPQYDKLLTFGGTTWQSSGRRVKLNLNCSYYS
jgi:hypothetical protein